MKYFAYGWEIGTCIFLLLVLASWVTSRNDK